MEGILTDTKQNIQKPAHMKMLGTAIVQRTGIPADKPVLQSVITSTKMGVKDKDVPELHKVHHVGKTQPRTFGQIPYAGPMY